VSWVGGLAEWEDGGTVYLSVAFTWKVPEAEARARFALALGKRVVVGGPALFTRQMSQRFEGWTSVSGTFPDAIARHNPDATIASRGCPVGCWFCIVPKMEGKAFTLIPDFPVRPILCDNNLSALPDEYQDHIIARYRVAGVRLRDANSGFEPRTFTEDTYARWRSLVNAGGGPWRFACDEMRELPDVRRVMRILREEPARRKQVYTLIGNESVAACLERIKEVIAGGCEPYAQPLLSLTALERQPIIRHDWNGQLLRDVARWVNRRGWRYGPFESYRRSTRPMTPMNPDLFAAEASR